ncbi:hypothetical protein FACUT_6 [Fusarium acutatum]|uniref:Uncharacterized protein n=1 Tax=Fusarium acutatum TaxID=78861 RepID=A0A8H4K8H7_9HYPO|nr:hypothetical protein FACUT_6 [Fusarium acutatum]
MAPLNVISRSLQAPRSRAFSRLQDKVWSAAVNEDDGKLKEIFETALEAKPDSEAHPVASNQPTSDSDIEANDPCESNALDWKSRIEKTVRTTLQRNQTPRNEALEDAQDWVQLIANTCRLLTTDDADQVDLPEAVGEPVSILFIAICRGHDINAKYLLKAPKVKIDLRMQFTWRKQTVLHQAVIKKNLNIVSQILRHNSMAPLEYLDIGNLYGYTPLYQATEEAGSHESVDVDGIMPKILGKLLQYRADVDATGEQGWTPLHNLILGRLNEASRACLKQLLEAKAEVNTKDKYDYPARLHAFSYILQTPMGGHAPETDKNTWLSWSPAGIKVSHVLYRKPEDTERLTEAGAGRSLPGRDTPGDDEEEDDDDGEVVNENQKSTFLSDCELRVKESVGSMLQDRNQREGRTEQETDNEAKSNSDGMLRDQLATKALSGRSWKWINFPANNMTWIQDFIIANIRTSDLTSVDPHAWQFFESNIRVRETNDSNARVRKPHAYAPAKDSSAEGATNLGDQMPTTSGKNTQQSTDTRELPSWMNAECFIKGSSMISLVIPFLDFENEMKEAKDELLEQERVIQRRYSPFTGMHGVQISQTLDDTASGFGQSNSGNGDLRTTAEQVIYRWSKKHSESEPKDDKQAVRARGLRTNGLRKLRYWLQKWFQKQTETVAEEAQTENEATNQNLPRIETGFNERANGKKANHAKNKAIQQSFRKSWLMVRQLWLWKLDDNTIITTIPTRSSHTQADDLLETIKQGNLYTVQSSAELIKRIVSETVKFIDEFKWAGLGHHVLDIFEGEISIEMDKEARYYKDFENTVKNLELVNKTISEAAHSTWQLKDIRDELRLLQRLFETQLEVVRKVAEILWPIKLPGNPSLSKEDRKTLRANFVRDLGLENLIQRVTRLNQDAYTTLGGVSTIIQAMQAQASLKEAESARFMNHIIIPFTIVTVIFTPLSFLTSLFAVNSDGFPHNDDGELRIPADWLGWNLSG